MRATTALTGQRTFPTHTSSTSEGWRLGEGILEKHPFRAVERRVEGAILTRAPLRARQRGVRTVDTITTSLGDFGVGAGGILN